MGNSRQRTVGDGPENGEAAAYPIGRKLGELLDLAIAGRTDGPVFLAPKGNGWRVSNLSRTYSRLRDNVGLPKDLVLYLARHECGTKICREKGIEYPADYSVTPTSARRNVHAPG